MEAEMFAIGAPLYCSLRRAPASQCSAGSSSDKLLLLCLHRASSSACLSCQATALELEVAFRVPGALALSNLPRPTQFQPQLAAKVHQAKATIDMSTASYGPYAFASLLALAECAAPHAPTPLKLPQVHYLFALCNSQQPTKLDCFTSDSYSLLPFFSGEFSSPSSISGSSSSSSSSSTCSSAPSSPTQFKPRRQLSLRDLLCTESGVSAVVATANRSGKPCPRRKCGMPECFKYALTGGFCIRHGGGKRCDFALGCQTVAQSGGRCKAHGGGSKCKFPNCGSVARRLGFCMAHGGRQTCKVAGCTKCAHGGGFCISHGGGKRCSAVTCTKSAQAGGFCYSHGGGKRCSAPECFQAARKGGFCIRHRKSLTYSPSSSQSLLMSTKL